MSRPVDNRFPWDEFIAHPTVRAAAYTYCDRSLRFVVNLCQLAANIDYSVKTLHRWKSEGAIPERAAERIAARLGEWPGSIWPDTYAELAAVA